MALRSSQCQPAPGPRPGEAVVSSDCSSLRHRVVRPGPTIAQLREVTQPPACGPGPAPSTGWPSAYLRDISPYLTRLAAARRLLGQRRDLADDPQRRAGRGRHRPGRRWPARSWPWCSSSCRCCWTAATVRWPAGGRPRRRKGSTWTGSVTTSPSAGSPWPSAIRASGGPQLSGVWISAGLLLGLLVALEQGGERPGARVPALRRAAADADAEDGPGADRRGAADGPADRPLRAVPPGLPLRRAVLADPGRRGGRSVARRAGHPGAADRVW